jgi:hypothetical protein
MTDERLVRDCNTSKGSSLGRLIRNRDISDISLYLNISKVVRKRDKTEIVSDIFSDRVICEIVTRTKVGIPSKSCHLREEAVQIWV